MTTYAYFHNLEVITGLLPIGENRSFVDSLDIVIFNKFWNGKGYNHYNSALIRLSEI